MEVETISLSRSELKKAMIKAGGDAMTELIHHSSTEDGERDPEFNAAFSLLGILLSAKTAMNAEKILFDKED